MLNTAKTRQLYESFVNDPKRAGGRGRSAFVAQVRHWLGLCDEQGNDHRNYAGNRVVREARLRPEEFDCTELAGAIVGPSWRGYFDPANPGSLAGVERYRHLAESQYPGDGRALLEATSAGVDVSAFANINTWTGVVGGLIERKILDAFTSPKFIADKLMPPEPTKMQEAQKVIGAARVGDKGQERQPGETHARAAFGERYVTLPKTRENALAIDVTKESVFFDLTGQILERAASVGEWLAYRKEIDCIDAFIGVTTGAGGKYGFNYKGATAATYTTTAVNGYTNQQTNDLVDWTSLESSWLLFMRMTDPESSTRILVSPNTILLNPARFNTGKLILGATRTERRTAGSATQATAATLQVQDTNSAPFAGEFEILMSPLVEQRCTDATGLGLTQTQANQNWWMYEAGRPFRYMQNWPLTILQAPPNSYDMIDRGVVASYFANERGCPSVWSPWHVVRNTH